MENNTKEILIGMGFNLWQTTNDTYGACQENVIVTQRFQKRLDIIDRTIPVCLSNDKLCVDVNITKHNTYPETAEIKIQQHVSDNPDVWSNIGFYCINISDFNSEEKVQRFIDLCLKMWQMSVSELR